MPNWQEIHTIVFDFDGIFTNNKVLVDENGFESVVCDRSDSLGLNFLSTFRKNNHWDLDFFVLSSESNNVVKQRCKKLKIKCVNPVENKLLFLKNYLKQRFNGNLEMKKGLLYLGNDLNDLMAINFSGYSIAPSDAHSKILESVDLILPEKGGCGFVRLFVESFLGLDTISLLIK